MVWENWCRELKFERERSVEHRKGTIMSEASGKELTNQTRSHKSLSMRLTPFKNKVKL